jgi:hypothetical protein
MVSNMDTVAAVTGEERQSGRMLNRFEAPALRPTVGHSAQVVESLGALVKPEARSLKRKHQAIITPIILKPTNAVLRRKITDAECKEHPAWADYLRTEAVISRQREMARLCGIVADGAALLHPVATENQYRARFEQDLRDQPRFLAALNELHRIRGCHAASANRKLREIRNVILLAEEQANVETMSKEGFNQRVGQFSEPSILVEAAIARKRCLCSVG